MSFKLLTRSRKNWAPARKYHTAFMWCMQLKNQSSFWMLWQFFFLLYLKHVRRISHVLHWALNNVLIDIGYISIEIHPQIHTHKFLKYIFFPKFVISYPVQIEREKYCHSIRWSIKLDLFIYNRLLAIPLFRFPFTSEFTLLLCHISSSST